MIALPRERWSVLVVRVRSSPRAAESRSEACCRNAATRGQSSSPANGRGSGRATSPAWPFTWPLPLPFGVVAATTGVAVGFMENDPRTRPGRCAGSFANNGRSLGSGPAVVSIRSVLMSVYPSGADPQCGLPRPVVTLRWSR